MLSRPLLSWATLFCGIALPLAVSAHGLGGYGIDKEVNGYLIDIGFSELVFRPQETTLINFQLWKNAPNYEMVPFTAVVVQFKEGNDLLFETRVAKAPLGWTGMNFTFPRSGEYTMHVDFQNDKESVVADTFPLTVEKAGLWMRILIYSYYVLSGVMSLGFLWLLFERWRTRKNAT